jgi:deoxyribonuclease V
MDLTNENDLAKLQEQLAQQIIVPDDTASYEPKLGDIVIALDIQYQGDTAWVAGAVQKWEEDTIQTFVGEMTAGIPYIPGFFCFREGPPLLDFLKLLEKQQQIIPDLIIVDGHGLAHPRKFGVACWLGLAMQKPTIGCAKKSMLQYQGDLGIEKESILPILFKNEMVGLVLRTQNGINPIFVSVGHLISLGKSKEVICNLCGAFRIPEIQRQADQVARMYARGETSSAITWLKNEKSA